VTDTEGPDTTRFTVAVARSPEVGDGPRPAWLKWYVLDVYQHFFIMRRHWPIRERFRISASSQEIEVHVLDGTCWFVVVPENTRWLRLSPLGHNRRLLAAAFEHYGFAVRRP
jgi:hypothetical protein